MNRRDFARASAGLLGAAVMPGTWSCQRPSSQKRSHKFARIGSGEFPVPVTRVTPGDEFYVHTYYDVCPFSPSQRYLAVPRLPYQDHNAVLGDTAEVCVIDLEEQTIETVYATKCWGFQTGANLHWGASDRRLYTNDIVDGAAVCVRIDRETGETEAFAGPMYDVAPDESCVITFPLELLDVTQLGYGVPSADPDNPPKLPPGAAADEGLWQTDLDTNRKRLILTLADVAARIPEAPPREGGTFYFWHSKFNRQGTRIMQISRCMFPDGWGDRNAMVFTLNPDGSDLRHIPSSPLWGRGGGHPNWHGDGEHIFRNLDIDGTARFCQWRWDGSEFRVLAENIQGGGHATIDPTGRYVLTDSFARDGGQKVNIRFVDLDTQTEQILCSLPTIDRQALEDTVVRLDGHPAWNRDHTQVCFQAAPEGMRQLFTADLRRIVSSQLQ